MNSQQQSPLNCSSIALFPGQGSQFVGMGKDLLENFKIVKELFEEASDSIHINLKKLCLDGRESDLTLTENTQPCLLVTSIAAFQVAVSETGYRPSAVAGHSLGEYSALVAAQAFPLSTAVRWVHERGKAMQAAVPAGQGTMAAVLSLDDQKIIELCKKATQNAIQKRAQGEHTELTVEAVVEPANFNSPGQVVIAGSTDAIHEAIQLIKSAPEFSGGKAIPLSVSAPFHCRLMAPARDRMANLFSAALAHETPKTLNYPYVPNRTGILTQEPGIVFELLVEQVDHPVLWKHSMAHLIEKDFNHFIEFGPGKVLSGLMKRIAQPLGKSCNSFQVSDTSSLKTTFKI